MEITVTVNGAAAEPWTTLARGPGGTGRVAAPRGGVRIYVAFSGGLDGPTALGSRVVRPSRPSRR